MAGPFIRLGDKLSHGGAVVQASPHSDSAGIGIARVGDKVACAVHGPGVIVTGDATMLVDGQPAARQGDKTSCGASLIASQQATTDQV
ncbi:PAAR domain-containing protein [Pseudoduganella namucuonensis]|uniref:Zn-binding Pro-Ala-Ala-Arg (PAAR) domain-containing protein, incolved in TypeVI secretion n=1 Tax=Pseudoduganella namucuonensis TaxID=1035707 RepID=A0A1I7JFF5_9BURK|nr:PAAR domain-containing protein [Pseudoduganella namucuonensis]SFU83889.1 Zn-binding Pro-Ala-Ala-Arg (PAAR) domain-containing protein, incolved in TypeVI secretion [Pseudoduganella namucuonensis]